MRLCAVLCCAAAAAADGCRCCCFFSVSLIRSYVSRCLNYTLCYELHIRYSSTHSNSIEYALSLCLSVDVDASVQPFTYFVPHYHDLISFPFSCSLFSSLSLDSMCTFCIKCIVRTNTQRTKDTPTETETPPSTTTTTTTTNPNEIPFSSLILNYSPNKTVLASMILRFLSHLSFQRCIAISQSRYFLSLYALINVYGWMV